MPNIDHRASKAYLPRVIGVLEAWQTSREHDRRGYRMKSEQGVASKMEAKRG